MRSEPVVEEIDLTILPDLFNKLDSHLFTLYFLRYTSPGFTFLFFRDAINISEAVDYAKKYCTNTLNARFVRLEPSINFITTL